MTITDRAARVLAEIDAALALAKEATLGPWAVEKYTNYHGFSVWGNRCCIAERWYKDAVTEKDAKELEGDAAFIAASRTGWPTSLRCLRTAIEGLLDTRKRSHPYWCDDELALTALCDQWEAGR